VIPGGGPGLTLLDWLSTTGGRSFVTRQASAENPSGGHGTGATRDPDSGHPDLVHSGPAVALGRGFKVRPYVPLPAGATLTLAEVDGEGVITHLYLTSDLPDSGQLRLRCWWDDEPEPSVDVPVANFFGMGHPDRPHELFSLPVMVGPAGGCSAWWPMPFARRAMITLTNTGGTDARVVAYRVTWNLGPVGGAPVRFHAAYRRSETSLVQPDHVIADGLAGPGLYVGTALAWTAAEPGWWGEGEVKFYLDGDTEFPTLVDSGTEDYFGGAWGFGRDAHHVPRASGDPAPVERSFCGPYAGCPLIETDESRPRRISLYRWHLADPIGFGTSLRATVQALGWGPDHRYRVRADTVASVAYWYSAA
jgi:Protein of unknown function (DUF2961)